MLNATLMLALALLVMVWLTLGRVQNLAEDTSAALNAALAPQAARLERIATSVEGIEAQFAAGRGAADLRDDVAGLRNDIAEIRAEIRAADRIGPQLLAERIVQVIGGWLATAKPVRDRPSDPS